MAGLAFLNGALASAVALLALVLSILWLVLWLLAERRAWVGRTNLVCVWLLGMFWPSLLLVYVAPYLVCVLATCLAVAFVLMRARVLLPEES